MQGVCKNIVGCDSTVVCCIDDVIIRVVHDSVVAYLMTVKNRDGQHTQKQAITDVIDLS